MLIYGIQILLNFVTLTVYGIKAGARTSYLLYTKLECYHCAMPADCVHRHFRMAFFFSAALF